MPFKEPTESLLFPFIFQYEIKLLVNVIYYADAIQRHFDVLALYWNPAVTGNVVDPFEVIGAAIVLFSVLTQAIV